MREHLTSPDPQQQKREQQTPDGMAFWAGTGPPATTCRECEHWLGGSYDRDKQLKPARCNKYILMMEAARPDAPAPLHRVPHYALACKYFERDPLPMPMFKPVIEKKKRRAEAAPRA